MMPILIRNLVNCSQKLLVERNNLLVRTRAQSQSLQFWHKATFLFQFHTRVFDFSPRGDCPLIAWAGGPPSSQVGGYARWAGKGVGRGPKTSLKPSSHHILLDDFETEKKINLYKTSSSKEKNFEDG